MIKNLPPSKIVSINKTVHLNKSIPIIVMKNFFSSLFGFISTPWWVKVTTAEPSCIYYFGPFENETEAAQARAGYVEDLQQEGAQQLQVSLENISEPEELTIEIEPQLPSSVMMTV